MRRWWTIATVVLALAVLAGWLPRLVGEAAFYRQDVWPLLRVWSEPDQQARLAAAPALADVLIQADRRLPPDAGVAFLTAGQDQAVDTTEYIAFHRALYYLSPRPVWWVVQAPDPRTERRPRWFRTALPSDAEWLLAYAVEPSTRGGLAKVADLGGGSSLVWLGPGPAPPTAERATTLWAGPAWPVGAALALLTVLAAGWAALAPLGRLGLRAGTIETVVLAWALGSVAVSLGLLLGCAVGLGLRASSAILAALAWGSCLWLRRDARARLRRLCHPTAAIAAWPTRWPPSRLASLALGLGLGLVVVYVGLLADGRPLQVWDSWVTWGMKARLIWQTDAIPTGVYADPTRAVTLLNYPLLVPLLEAWLYTWVGAPDDRLAGLVNVASYAGLLGLGFAALRARGADVLLGLLGAAYLASIWALAGLAGLAFADVPLALFALLAGVSLVRWLEGGPPATLVVAAVSAGALGWTKREGLVLLGLFVLAGLVAGRGSRRVAAAPALALGGLVIAGPWLAFVAWRGLPDWQFVPIAPQVAVDNRERLSFVFGTLARWSLDADWSFPSVWLVGLVALGLSVARRGLRPADLLPLVSAAYLLLLGASYLFSAFDPYQTHVLASLGRLMAQVAPVVGVWLVSRWAELRPSPAPLPRRAPADASPSSPPGSSADRRTPALEGLGSASGAPLLPRPRPGTPPD
jgi:hypothetical protein